MADFASITDGYGLTFWINLAFIYRIDVGLDPQEPMTVKFTNGESMSLPRPEGEALIAQLNLCCALRPNAGSGSSTQKKQSGRGRTTAARKSQGSRRPA